MAPSSKQPIPRTLSPEIPVVSYPTPNVSDLLVVQDVDTRTPGYMALEYGDLHPDQSTYPGLKLVLQMPLDNEQNFMWVRRVYANDRNNQELYNYAIKYSGEDPSKPIYVRTYTLLREGYNPIAKGSADPVYPDAVLVEEEVQRLKDDQDDGQLDSQYIKVVRTYETIPGPGLSKVTYGSAQIIPPKFQAAQTVVLTTTTVAPGTLPDAITPTTIESTVEQASVAKAQKTTSTISNTPVTLTGQKFTPQQQVAAVNETLVDTGADNNSFTPSALVVEASSENLGNGKSVLSVISVDSVFSEQTYSTQRPDVLPDKFKVALPTTTTSDVEAGTAVQPSLSAGQIAASQEQTTLFKVKKSTTSRETSSPVSLTGYKETPQQQLGTVSETYDPTGQQTPTLSATVVEASVEALGDGSSVMSVTTVDSVFAEQVYTAERPNVLPAKFQVAIPTTTTSSIAAGTATIPSLSTGDLSKTQQQLTEFKIKSSSTSRDTALPVSLTGYKETPQQQLGTVSETYDPTGQQIPTLSATVVEANVEALGDGSSVMSVTSVNSVFAEQTYSEEKPLWGIPMKFKVANPPLKQSSVVAGTVSKDDVTLDAWDMEASSEQITEFKKRVTKSSMNPSDVSLVGSQTGMWGVESVTELLSSDPNLTAEGGYTVKENSVEPLGDGRSVSKKTLYPSNPATLVEYHMDETYKILVKMEKTLVSLAGYTPPSTTANQVLELHAIDAWNAIQIVSSVNSVPTSETWEHTIHYTFPDELVEVGINYNSSTSGEGNSGGVNSQVSQLIPWRADAKANAQAKITGVPYSTIKKGYSGPVRAQTVRTYSLSIPTDQTSPTLIVPVFGAIVVSGTGESAEYSGTIQGVGPIWSSAGSSSGGSRDIVAFRHTFGPVLHDNPTLTTSGETTATQESSATSGSIPSGAYPVATATANASIDSQLILPASTGTLSGKGTGIIADVIVEKWRFGIWITETTTIYHP